MAGMRYAPCGMCKQMTAHNVVAVEDRSSEEGSDVYYFLTCAGCRCVSMANQYNSVMGIRAFLEQLMILKVGDQGTFEANLDEFLREGYISKMHRKAMSHILDSGHAAIHRMHKPTEEDLNIALDITEAITAAIYFHESDAKSVAERVPPRTPRPPKV